jgi:hypothetical protein
MRSHRENEIGCAAAWKKTNEERQREIIAPVAPAKRPRTLLAMK